MSGTGPGELACIGLGKLGRVDNIEIAKCGIVT